MKLSLVTIPLLAVVAVTQAPGAHWSMTNAGTNPPRRRENPGTADMSNMYMFGGITGQSGGVAVNDLWRFDGTAWTQMTADGAVGSPPARFQAGVTWDFAINQLVVFGGRDATGTDLADTWNWDPNTNVWTETTPAVSPSARRFTAMTYDPATASVVMLGGLDAAGTHLNDTWLLAGGGTWVPMTPATLPPVRRQHHLVTRTDFGDVLMCGGQDATLVGAAKWRRDTWTWNGTDWTEIVTATLPVSQVANDATYDPLRQRVVLASGNGSGGSPTALINEFDCIINDWVIRPLDPGIFKVSRYFAAYIPALGKTFKASGQHLNAAAPSTETYEFQSDLIATATDYGTGCAGPGGSLALASNSRPWTSRTWSATCSNLGSNSLALAVWGENQASTPLQPLLPIAGAGCLLLNDALILNGPQVVVGGVATESIAIPDVSSLSGIVLNLQMAELEFDVGFNWIGLYTSNGVTITIGAI